MKKIKLSPFVPNKYEVEKISSNHAKISIYPFDIGYAITLAHPLKRIILSSTAGYAPIAVKFENASHEFDSIRGVFEDVASLIVNLKNIRFKIKDEDKQSVELEYLFKGPADIKGSDFNNEFVEIVTPDAHFATINEDGELGISLIIQQGIGYIPSEDIRDEVKSSFLPLDAYFMPVKKANYTIEKVLVEDNPNFEKIVFDIVTDAADPSKIFNDAVKVMLKQIEVFGIESDVESSNKIVMSKENEELLNKFVMKIEELNLSARSHNALTIAKIKYVGELALMSEADLGKVKNLGKKSLDEIKQSVIDLGLHMGASVNSEVIEAFKETAEQQKE